MVWLMSIDAKINGRNSKNYDDEPKWQNVFKAQAHGSPQILQSTNLALRIVSAMDEST